MIPFKDLIHSLFDAASKANNSFAGKGSDGSVKGASALECKGESAFLETYFDQAVNEDGSAKTMENSHGGQSPVYTPKTVMVEYPTHNENEQGDLVADSHAVEVPLIAVTKVRATKIDSLKLSANLEIALNDGELMAAFAGEEKRARNKGASLVHMELNITPDMSSDGMTSIVEGYSKALRTRIPN
ncbi:hypothetical protein Rhal01_02227 [Rubritalea halochordaticola]|uniref:DUF2589 domain-containing protein n=1 Tax=Rubritalea halochordaticola TaxID=714537 RepID=A0ABP9V026_9BACT